MIETNGDNTEELISSAAKGDMQAMEALLQKYESLIYRLAYSSLRSGYDAADVTQEVLFKIYKTVTSFRGECTFSTWVYRITCNCVTDFIRKKSRRSTVSLSYIDQDTGDDAEQDIPDESTAVSPQLMLEKTELAAEIRSALSELSEQHRKILVLRDMEGYSYSELSEMLGLDIGTVKSRLNRARNSLKRILESGNIIRNDTSLTKEIGKE